MKSSMDDLKQLLTNGQRCGEFKNVVPKCATHNYVNTIQRSLYQIG